MSLLLILGISIALGCDAFTVGLAAGTTSPDRRASFRLWFHFGLFQSLLFLLGWHSGTSLKPYIEDYDHWVASGLLCLIAFKMLTGSMKDPDPSSQWEYCAASKGWRLVSLSIATSLDALGVGMGLGISEDSPLFIASSIGIIAALMTYIGVKIGRRLSLSFGKGAETCGALILFLIAFKLLEI